MSTPRVIPLAAYARIFALLGPTHGGRAPRVCSEERELQTGFELRTLTVRTGDSEEVQRYTGASMTGVGREQLEQEGRRLAELARALDSVREELMGVVAFFDGSDGSKGPMRDPSPAGREEPMARAVIQTLPTTQPTRQRTYGQGSERASWRWQLPDGARVEALLVEALDGLAVLGRTTRARVVTLTGGDESWLGELITSQQRQALLDFVRHAQGVCDVICRFDVVVHTPAGDQLLKGAGSLALQVVHMGDGRRESQLSLTLYTDLYDPDAAACANRDIARANAAPLAAFLRWVPRALGAQLVEIEARSASTPGPFGYAFDDEGDDEC